MRVQSEPLSLNVQLRRTAARYTKFLMVGAANAVVDLVVLNGLLLIDPNKSPWWLSACNTIAVICAIVNSYFWNRRWTFADISDGSAQERWWFIVQACINILLNDLVVVWVSSYLVFAKSVPLFVSSNVSKALAMFISSSASYVLMRILVFRGSPRCSSP